MAQEARTLERVLATAEEDGEQRTVSLVVGPSLSLMEQSHGLVTLAAYGSSYHGHKMLFERDAASRVLGVDVQEVEEALAGLFSSEPEPPLLSDVMDRFDTAEERYTYLAWSSEGDAAYRPGMCGEA